MVYGKLVWLQEENRNEDISIALIILEQLSISELRYMHRAWKRHQDAVFWVDIDHSIKEGLMFYQTRSNVIILQGTLPAHCILNVEILKTGEMLYEKRYLSPRPPPKISLKPTVEQQPVGKLIQQSLGESLQTGSSKPTQSNPNPICDRTGKPVETERVFVERGKNVPFTRDCW